MNKPCVRETGFVSAWYMEGMILLAIVLIVGIVAYNGFRDYGVKKNMAETIAVGRLVTRSLDAYLKQHKTFPDDIRQLGLSVTSPLIKGIRLDKTGRALEITTAFSPVDGGALLFHLQPGPAEGLWNCSGKGIPDMYLRDTCRH